MADKDWRTVKLPVKLVEEIEEMKEKHGFSSNSDFITQGARELIIKYKKERFEHINFQENVIRLVDNEKPKGNPFIEIEIKNNALFCNNCELFDCVHVIEVWRNDEISKQLSVKGVMDYQKGRGEYGERVVWYIDTESAYEGGNDFQI